MTGDIGSSRISLSFNGPFPFVRVSYVSKVWLRSNTNGSANSLEIVGILSYDTSCIG